MTTKLALSPLRNLMAEQGAEIVAADALLKYREAIEAYAKELAERSVFAAKHGNRKKVMVKDLELVLR
jgi:histone H3/H4